MAFRCELHQNLRRNFFVFEIIKLTQSNYLRTLENAIRYGQPCLLEVKIFRCTKVVGFVSTVAQYIYRYQPLNWLGEGSFLDFCSDCHKINVIRIPSNVCCTTLIRRVQESTDLGGSNGGSNFTFGHLGADMEPFEVNGTESRSLADCEIQDSCSIIQRLQKLPCRPQSVGK